MRYAFTIWGRPRPHARMTQGQLRSSRYLSPAAAAYLAYKELIGWHARAAKVKRQTGPMSLSCRFYIHGGRYGDIDNLLKAVADGLNGIAYDDDRQVVEIHAKRYPCGEKTKERCEVVVKEFGS